MGRQNFRFHKASPSFFPLLEQLLLLNACVDYDVGVGVGVRVGVGDDAINNGSIHVNVNALALPRQFVFFSASFSQRKKITATTT